MNDNALAIRAVQEDRRREEIRPEIAVQETTITVMVPVKLTVMEQEDSPNVMRWATASTGFIVGPGGRIIGFYDTQDIADHMARYANDYIRLAHESASSVIDIVPDDGEKVTP